MTERKAIHSSYWVQDSPLQAQYPRLQGWHKTQVAVLGGGITGLSIALELLQRGYQVTVLEAHTIGSGTTGGSTGHLEAHPEVEPATLLRQLGAEDGRAYVAQRMRAIEVIEQRADAASDVQRIPGYYYSERNDRTREIRKQMEAAMELGLQVEWTRDVPLPYAAEGFRIDHMGRMHAANYLKRLAELVVEAGGFIFENTFGQGSNAKHATTMQAGQGTLEFEHLVLAVHCNFSDVQRVYFQTPPYQSYVVAARVSNPPPDALFWDDNDPYYYTRRALTIDPELIIVGGCDHRTGMGNPLAAQAQLRQYVSARFELKEFVSQWSAELFEPVDGRPLIGKLPHKDNIWVATGLSGVGLTWGTAAGWLIADGIMGRTNRIHQLLSPARMGMQGMKTLFQEHLKTAADYSERVLPAHRFDADHLGPGEGAVGVVNHEHVAACRDRSGCAHRLSPICTHMGGVVHWNEAEQTWDCPVHGGRFSASGKRLYGPPASDLGPPKPSPINRAQEHAPEHPSVVEANSPSHAQ
jgi:glycine/D-amino acid oxidase-like deaminating enzyme/nitrite reductase/ring-hydroxylating ferredoxin subunit